MKWMSALLVTLACGCAPELEIPWSMPGEVRMDAFSGDLQEGVAGEVPAQPLVVRVLELDESTQIWMPLGQVEVLWSGPGTELATTTNEAGYAVFQPLLPSVLGEHVYTAAARDLDLSVQFHVTAVDGTTQFVLGAGMYEGFNGAVAVDECGIGITAGDLNGFTVDVEAVTDSSVTVSFLSDTYEYERDGNDFWLKIVTELDYGNGCLLTETFEQKAVLVDNDWFRFDGKESIEYVDPTAGAACDESAGAVQPCVTEIAADFQRK